MMDSRSEQWRPEYHFSPTDGWMNDPNGLVYHDGAYHLFYQAGERQRRWDHAVSADLLTWSEQGTKIPVDSSVEAFSGGAVVDRDDTADFGTNALVYTYTGHHDDGTEDQRLAYSSDGGETVHTYEKNPVIESAADNFRDPNTFWYEPDESWRMVVGRIDRTEERPAGVEIYSSDDLRDWTYESTYRAPNGEEWECPSLLELPVAGTKETRWVLIVSPVELGSVEYHVGRFDGTAFTAENVIRADHGHDFYAAQHWANEPENRGLVISWMNNWEYAMDGPDPGWRGVMTIPRTISLEGVDGDIEVRQRPATEVTEARGDAIAELTSETIAPDEDPLYRADIESRAFEIVASIDPRSADAVGLRVREGIGQESRIVYDARDEELRFDRTNSGALFDDDTYGESSVPLATLEDGTIELRVLVDRCSVELFANGGRRTMTNLVYPDWESAGASLFSEGGVADIERLVAYDLAAP